MRFTSINFLFLVIIIAIFITGCQNPQVANGQTSNLSGEAKENVQEEKLINIKDINMDEEFFLIKDRLQQYPNTRILLNIHDKDISLEKNQSTVKINEKSIAKITFYVSQSTNFKENLKFSETISNKINSKYPDVSRGILIQGSEQHLNEKVPSDLVIISIGGSKNTLAEKKAAMNILVEAINN